MALRDLLNLVSAVTIMKKVSSDDGMGGMTSTTISTILPLAALWQNSAKNWYVAGKYAEDSTHTLCFEYGAYTFGTPVSSSTVIETVFFNGDIYETVGKNNDVMFLHEIVVQYLELTK